MSKSIILIGYRATGKSTIAKMLSNRLGLRFIDSDVIVEQKAGKSISKIFAEDGETAFRDLEEETIRECVNTEAGLCCTPSQTGSKVRQMPIILATGGGAILRKSTRDLLRTSGLTVWLCASPETILRRMSGDITTGDRRPSLTNLPPRDEVVKLLKSREQFYRETANLVLDTDSVPIEQLLENILTAYCDDKNKEQ